MPPVRRPRMSATEKSELWVRWKQGESLIAIGRGLGRVPRSIYREWSPGAVWPRSRDGDQRWR